MDFMIFRFVVLQMRMLDLGYMHLLVFWSYVQVSTTFANTKGSDKTALMHTFTYGFAGSICDKYPFLIFWLECGINNDKNKSY